MLYVNELKIILKFLEKNLKSAEFAPSSFFWLMSFNFNLFWEVLSYFYIKWKNFQWNFKNDKIGWKFKVWKSYKLPIDCRKLGKRITKLNISLFQTHQLCRILNNNQFKHLISVKNIKDLLKNCIYTSKNIRVWFELNICVVENP